MPFTHKQLAQSQPAAGVDTTVYTVPGATKTLVYGIVAANVGAAKSKFRIHIVPSGGSAGLDNAIYYDITVPKNDTFVANISVTMETGGFIVVRSDNGNTTFTISGMEIT
jgi:hypothetical protein